MTAGLLQIFAAALATAGLLVAGWLFRPAAFFINILVPLPIALLTLRNGAGSGCAAVLACVAGLQLAGDFGGDLLYLAQAGCASLLLPALLRRGWHWDRAVALAALFAAMSIVLLLVAESARQGTDIRGLVKAYATAEVAQARTVYVDAPGVTQEQREGLLQALEETERFLIATWPAIMFLLAATLLLIQVWFLRSFPASRGSVAGSPFADWKSPEALVWPLIAAGFGALLGDGAVRGVAVNLLVVLVPVYYLQGLAIMAYFFRQRGAPLWLKIPGYLLSLLNPFPFVVAGVGLFDIWANFRKPRVAVNKD